MKTNLIVAVGFAIAAAGCSPAPVQSTPVTTQVPKPTLYEYSYEIANTRTACEPDIATWTELDQLAYGLISDKTQADAAAQKAAVILQCTQTQLQTELTQRGADGWKLVTFETIAPAQYDLGIEYSYRLVWERQK